MKHYMSILLVFILLFSSIAFGETVSQIDDVSVTEIADATDEAPIETIDEAPAENISEEPEATPAPEAISDTVSIDITDANSEEESAAVPDSDKDYIFTFSGKLVNGTAEEEEILDAVTIPFPGEYAIKVNGLSEGQAVIYKSSNKKYATVSNEGIVTFKKATQATITVTVIEGENTVYTKEIVFTAVKAKFSISLPNEMPTTAAMYSSSLLINKGTKLQLSAVNTTKSVTWKTSNKKIVTVSSKGLITAKAKGTAKITATTKDNKKATLTVKVLGAKDAVAISLSGDTALSLSEKGKLTYTLSPKKSTNTVKWSSSNKKVCTVSSKGVLTPKKCGTATITATASSGVKTSIKVTISNSSTTVYRALVIGQSYAGAENELPGCLRDAEAFKRMLGTMKTTSYKVTKKTNLDAEEILNSIQTTFSDADANDVSLFYYSGHGGEQTGALIGDDFYGVEVTELKEMLDTIPGTKIVILDSCFSGKMISANGEETETASPADVDNYIISVFKNDNTVAKTLGSKYYVISACRDNESSQEWSLIADDSIRFGAFTYFLLYGSGYDEINLKSIKTLEADTNNDGAISLTEGKTFANECLLYNTDEQHVVCYPSNSSYTLWQR